MGKLWIIGLGPGGLGLVTREALQAIEQADKVVLRTAVHPAASELLARRKDAVACDRFYESGESFSQIYESIADFVIAEAGIEAGAGKMLCYCVPGHPLVAEETVRLILRKLDASVREAGAVPQSVPRVRVLPALSFLDAAFVQLGIDPIRERLTLLDAAPLWSGDRSGILPLPAGSCLYTQVYDRLIASELKLALLEEALPDAETLILYHTGIVGEERLIPCPLAELDHFKGFDHLTSVYLPIIGRDGKHSRIPEPNGEHSLHSGFHNAAAAAYPLDPLVEVFYRLLGPEGCPWDRKQTHESLKPYLLEEANEAAEAIDEKDMAHLKEELGDVLMQIVFHSALAEGRGDFDINDVITGITDKMIRRHPHVFGEEKVENAEEVAILWEKIKQNEKTG